MLFGGAQFLQGGVTFTQNQRPMQNLSEMAPSQEELLRRNNDNLSRQIRVAIPAEVVSFDAVAQTIVAQPLIREKVINRQDGSLFFVNLPQILDVPVHFQQAGNFVLTMPVQAGDECLLIFADMCIDSWWTSAGIQNWNDRRRHDLSDAFAIVGINSKPNAIENIATDAAELRTKDGDCKIRIEDDQIAITASEQITATVGDASITITDDTLTAVGGNSTLTLEDDSAKLETGGTSVEVNGTEVILTGDLIINGDRYDLHLHSGVNNGADNSGPVVP